MSGPQAAEQHADLAEQRCTPCEGGTPPLDDDQIAGHMKALPDWQRDGDAIFRAFKFKNYYRTMAFVNAVAWIAHTEGHHPDMTVSYNACRVSYTTHAIGGLSDNDFICAAKVDDLMTAG